MTGIRIGSLFSGYGGLERGVQEVLGDTVAWHSEIDPGACKILAHRYPDVPNLGDITAVDWSQVEPVDVLTGGSPCQDLSHAGKRGGMTEGTRSNLWVAMRDAIEQLRPSLVVWENVRGAYSAPADSELESREGRLGIRNDGPVLRALGRVLGDLCELGFDAEWVGLRASDVGAPHGRFRVFVVAWPAADAKDHGRKDQRLTRRDGAEGPVFRGDQRASAHAHPADDGRERGRLARVGWNGSADDGDAAADPICGGRDGWAYEPVGLQVVGTAVAGDRSGAGAWGPYGDAIRRWERLTRPAPAPTDPGPRGAHRLSARAVEWMMGLPAGWVTDVPGLSRNEQLKALGNGVVPQQAAQALRMLLPDAVRAAA